MGKNIILFLDVVSGNAQIISTSVLSSTATLISARSNLSQMIDFNSVNTVLVIAWGVVVLQIIIRFALRKRKQDFATAISNLIKQGNALIPLLDHAMYRGGDKVIDQQEKEWEGSVNESVSKYDSDLVSLLVVDDMGAGNKALHVKNTVERLREILPLIDRH